MDKPSVCRCRELPAPGRPGDADGTRGIWQGARHHPKSHPSWLLHGAKGASPWHRARTHLIPKARGRCHSHPTHSQVGKMPKPWGKVMLVMGGHKEHSDTSTGKGAPSFWALFRAPAPPHRIPGAPWHGHAQHRAGQASPAAPGPGHREDECDLHLAPFWFCYSFIFICFPRLPLLWLVVLSTERISCLGHRCSLRRAGCSLLL